MFVCVCVCGVGSGHSKRDQDTRNEIIPPDQVC